MRKEEFKRMWLCEPRPMCRCTDFMITSICRKFMGGGEKCSRDGCGHLPECHQETKETGAKPMSEIDQLKKRIDDSGSEGVLTSHIREDYEPAGDMMIRGLLDSGEYVSRKTPLHDFNQKWRIFRSGNEPY